jgi:hypothetical protein
MENIKNQAFKNSLYISALYVGVGTVGLFAMSSKIMENEIVSIIVLLVNLITMPASFIGFGIIYGDGAGLLALGAQIITFLFYWFVLYRYLLKRYKRQLKLK